MSEASVSEDGGLQFSPDERVGALGGTFDPPHRAHLHLADAAAQALELDRLILIPPAIPGASATARSRRRNTDWQ